MRSSFYFLLVALSLVGASYTPAIAEKAMHTSTLSTQSKWDWPGAADASATALGKKLAAACLLKTMPGLDFGAGLTAYRCDVSIPSGDSDKEQREWRAELVSAFGEVETDRLMKRDIKEVLNSDGGMGFMSASLVVLADAQNQLSQVIAIGAELKQALKGVTSKEGAASLVYLQNTLDNHPLNDLFKHANYAEDGDGWTISKISQRRRLGYNNEKSVTLHVSKSGVITKR